MPNASSGRLRLRTRTDDSCPGFERSNVFWSPGVYPPRDFVPARTPFLPSSGYLQRPVPANWRRSMRRAKLAAVISESSPVRYWAAATVPAPAQIRTRPNPLRAGIRRREDRTKYWREPLVSRAWQRRDRYTGARRGDGASCPTGTSCDGTCSRNCTIFSPRRTRRTVDFGSLTGVRETTGARGREGRGAFSPFLAGGRDQPMCLRASRRVSFERDASCDPTKRPTPAGSTRA